jgi:hypothetical protein
VSSIGSHRGAPGCHLATSALPNGKTRRRSKSTSGRRAYRSRSALPSCSKSTPRASGGAGWPSRIDLTLLARILRPPQKSAVLSPGPVRGEARAAPTSLPGVSRKGFFHDSWRKES